MKNLRQHKLVEYIQLRGQVGISELLLKFDLSRATLHRYLTDLESQGAIIRSRGLVQCPHQDSTPSERPFYSRFQDRLIHNHGAKLAAAQRALPLIKDGDILFLDSSTTVYFLARELQRQSFSNLTIITNSVLIIQEFSEFPIDYTLIALGGNYDPQLNAFLGAATETGLQRIRISKAFISALGVTSRGASSRHEFHAAFLRQAIAASQHTYLLLTEDKFNREGPFPIARIDQFAGVISSGETLPDYCPTPLA